MRRIAGLLGVALIADEELAIRVRRRRDAIHGVSMPGADDENGVVILKVECGGCGMRHRDRAILLLEGIGENHFVGFIIPLHEDVRLGA